MSACHLIDIRFVCECENQANKVYKVMNSQLDVSNITKLIGKNLLCRLFYSKITRDLTYWNRISDIH